jgi:hypothetical protein
VQRLQILRAWILNRIILRVAGGLPVPLLMGKCCLQDLPDIQDQLVQLGHQATREHLDCLGLMACLD